MEYSNADVQKYLDEEHFRHVKRNYEVLRTAGLYPLSPKCVKSEKILEDFVNSWFALETGVPLSQECDICNKLFATEEYLLHHRQEHYFKQELKEEEWDVKITSCEDSKPIFQSTNLKKQSRRRNSGKKYQCSECGRIFSFKGNLMKHIGIHTGYKPFECMDCSKRFRLKCNFEKHRRVHTGLRPFVCATCSRAFSQRCSLTSHHFTHTGEKPYNCPHCGYRTARLSNLRRHVKAKHVMV